MTVLTREKIKVNVRADNKYDAIRLVGGMLAEAGHVPAEYVDYMIKREDDLSTYMGAALAIPHGTNEAKKLVRSTGLAVAVLPEGVDFGNGQIAKLVVGIAAVGDDHMDLLTNIAMLVSDQENMDRLLQSDSADEVLQVFLQGVEG